MLRLLLLCVDNKKAVFLKAYCVNCFFSNTLNPKACLCLPRVSPIYVCVYIYILHYTRIITFNLKHIKGYFIYPLCFNNFKLLIKLTNDRPLNFQNELSHLTIRGRKVEISIETFWKVREEINQKVPLINISIR